MNDSKIAIDPAVCSGKPHVKDTRLTVELLQGLLVTGWSRESILGVYPYLTPDSLEAALTYPKAA